MVGSKMVNLKSHRVDSSPTAKTEFWKARDQWFPTWQDKGELIIKRVKVSPLKS